MAYYGSCAAAYARGRNDGYLEGLNVGRREGYAAGYQRGLQEGYQAGYQEGFSKGKAEGYWEGVNSVRDSCKKNVLSLFDPRKLVSMINDPAGLLGFTGEVYENVLSIVGLSDIPGKVLRLAALAASRMGARGAKLLLEVAHLLGLMDPEDPRVEIIVGSPGDKAAAEIDVDGYAKVFLPHIPVARFTGGSCTPPSSSEVRELLERESWGRVDTAALVADFQAYLALLLPEWSKTRLDIDTAAKLYVDRAVQRVKDTIAREAGARAGKLAAQAAAECRRHLVAWQLASQVAADAVKALESLRPRLQGVLDLTVSKPVIDVETVVYSDGRVERRIEAEIVVTLTRMYREERGVKGVLKSLVSKKYRLERRMLREAEENLVREVRDAAARVKASARSSGVSLRVRVEGP